jgi:hypothetical protein
MMPATRPCSDNEAAGQSPRTRFPHPTLSKKEIIRCLKRYVARELYKILTSPKTRNQGLTPAA